MNLSGKQIGALAEHIEASLRAHPNPIPDPDDRPSELREKVAVPDGFKEDWELDLEKRINSDSMLPEYTKLPEVLVGFLVDTIDRYLNPEQYTNPE